MPEDLPPVRADRGLLERVLVNLIDNALRHGGRRRAGRVTALAGAEQRQAGGHRSWPRGAQEERGASCSSPSARSTTVSYGGLGLGSAVARGFVEAMDGALVADETPGGGLTMRLAVARRCAATPRRPMTRVLVVEDERGLRRALQINLGARGYEVDSGRGRALGAGRGLAPAARCRSSSTWGCPTWTGSR